MTMGIGRRKMLSLGEFLEKTKDKAKIYEDFRLEADRNITDKLTICIPDIHLLERGPNDDFFDQMPEYEQRFMSLLDFILELRESEKEDLEIIQLGDMFDLWQAKGNTNMIAEAYTDILGLLDKIKTIYVVGNHDIDLIKWYKDKGETFGRKWRHYSQVEGKLRAMYEHGFQADFANNQNSWMGAIGKEITKIIGMMEYIEPDIDVILGAAWDSIVKAFGSYNEYKKDNVFTHEYLKFYINLMEKYNRGETLDHFGPEDIDLTMTVIGHTHKARLVQMPKDGKTFYLMDCGSWVNGGHEIGVISGKDIAVCQWG